MSGNYISGDHSSNFSTSTSTSTSTTLIPNDTHMTNINVSAANNYNATEELIMTGTSDNLETSTMVTIHNDND